MGEENQTIDLIKNLPTQTGDRRIKPKISEIGWLKPDPTGLMKNLPIQTEDEGEKSNNFEKRSEWSQEVQGSIFYCKEDASNAWKRTLSQVIEEMKVICEGR